MNVKHIINKRVNKLGLGLIKSAGGIHKTEEVLFSNFEKVILEELDKATSKVKIAVTWFTNKKILERILILLKNDVKVQIILSNDLINRGKNSLNFKKLEEAGAKIYFCELGILMNHKFCIIDSQVLLTGTYNWTYFDENNGMENLIKFENNFVLINNFLKCFKQLKGSLKKVQSSIKFNLPNQDQHDLFSLKHYLAMDLLYQSKETQSLVPLENALSLLPSKQTFIKEYNKMFEAGVRKKLTSTLGIEARQDGIDYCFSEIIEKGTIIPCTESRSYSTAFDNQTEVQIKTFNGDNPLTNENELIGEFLASGLPPLEAGKAEIIITFSIDDKGFLTVTSENSSSSRLFIMKYDIKELIF